MKKRIYTDNAITKLIKIGLITNRLQKFIDHHIDQYRNTVWMCLFTPGNILTKKCKIFKSHDFVVKHICCKHKKELISTQKNIEEQV